MGGSLVMKNHGIEQNMDDQQPPKKTVVPKLKDVRQSLPLSLNENSENQDIPRYAQTQRGPEQPDGYAISFNEKEQLKYKGLMVQAQQVQKPKSLRNDSIDPNEMSNPALMLSD